MCVLLDLSFFLLFSFTRKQILSFSFFFITEQGYQYAPYAPTDGSAPPSYYDNPPSGTGYYNQMSALTTMYCPPSGQPVSAPPSYYYTYDTTIQPDVSKY